MPDTPAKPETKSVLLLFIGRRAHPKQKQYWLWYKLDPSQNDGKPLKYDPTREAHYSGKPIIKGARPGMVVEVQATLDDKSIFPGTAKHDEPWENRDDVAKWNALHRAVELEIDAGQRSVKDIKGALPMELLAPFRRAYNAANSRHKNYILAWVIAEITRYT